MRASTFGFAAIALASFAAHAAGCGGKDTSGSGGGSGGGSTSGANPCDPANISGCKVAQDVTSDCLALTDNSKAASPSLRMAQISITKPAALASILVKAIVDSGVTINLPSCNLGDSAPSSTNGNFNWLLQFDLAHGKLKTGGAKPVTDPTQGYAFASGSISQNGMNFDVGPVTIAVTVKSDGTFTGTQGVDLAVPIYQDKMGKTAIILPLHDARIASGTLSDGNSCIGTYDVAGLSPDANCKNPDGEPYKTAGSVAGYITLEEADKVSVPTANTTLCAIIAGAPTMPNCSRTNGKIDFKGDYCSTTMMPGGCQDAVQLAGEFAAAAVKVSN